MTQPARQRGASTYRRRGLEQVRGRAYERSRAGEGASRCGRGLGLRHRLSCMGDPEVDAGFVFDEHGELRLSCMGDLEVDVGFVFDEQGRTDILGSPFFDVFFGFDETAADYIDRILYQLSLSLEERIRPGRWVINRQPPPPATSPTDTILRATCLTPPAAVARPWKGTSDRPIGAIEAKLRSRRASPLKSQAAPEALDSQQWSPAPPFPPHPAYRGDVFIDPDCISPALYRRKAASPTLSSPLNGEEEASREEFGEREEGSTGNFLDTWILNEGPAAIAGPVATLVATCQRV
ncbi:hypothetical protein M5K25_006068 [Dendrobium thyrsiflorum]|uniref:Uncharacterized protein n=1 Tax=Dendrobium thyrsiflorum TaxID=117978 RepID=A0ABD0VHK1_DENTH